MTHIMKNVGLGLYGVDIHCVPDGTEIEHQGEKLTVTDENAVNLGRAIYCTEKVVNALKKISTDINREARK